MSHHGKHGYTKTKQVRAVRAARADDIATASGYSKLTTQQKLDHVLAMIASGKYGFALRQKNRLEEQLKLEQLQANAASTTKDKPNTKKAPVKVHKLMEPELVPNYEPAYHKKKN